MLLLPVWLMVKDADNMKRGLVLWITFLRLRQNCKDPPAMGIIQAGRPSHTQPKVFTNWTNATKCIQAVGVAELYLLPTASTGGV